MTKTLLKILLLMFSVSLPAQQQSDTFRELFKSYDNKDYFRFIYNTHNTGSNLNDIEKNILQSFICSISNKQEESNRLIKTILSNNNEKLQDTLMLELYETMLQNSFVTYDYAAGLKCAQIIMEDYKQILDSNGVEEYENILDILTAAKELGRQTAEIKGDTRVEVKKDMAGFSNIPIKINGMEEEFIFDTGANISTIIKSLAVKLKLVFLKGTIKVGSITDKKIDSELAYAELLEIGKITYKNVLFLVLPDDALSFAGGLYTIDGIIGYPVFREMKEINLTKDELSVPLKPNPKQEQNLVMDGFTPVVNAVVNKDTLAFTFDTGARTTILYNKFYEKYKKDIDKKYELDEVDFEGAGGSVKVKGFELDKLNISIAGSIAKIEEVKLLAVNVKNTDKYFYGNLGQDFFKQFKTLIINLESMYVEFKR